MAPPGVTIPFIGNNPFSFAFAAGEKYPEVCVDMATSAAAFGKAKAYALAGKPIPEGWLLDKQGNPTTELSEYGMLVPMAEHKGFGVAFIVELFTTLLSGCLLYTSRQTIATHSVADLSEMKGVKFRVPSTPLQIEMVKAMGASPTTCLLYTSRCV